MKHSLLIIEDDPAIASALRDSFEEEQFFVEHVSDGAAGFDLAKSKNFDCVLLDLMLPSMNGREICRLLRENGYAVPIIMLTSKKDEVDKVIGLEIGADDYVTKPFSMRELIARVHVQLRRSHTATSLPHPSEIIRFGDITVNCETQECVAHGKSHALSAKETNIIRYFAQNEGKIITREMLLDNVWGYEHFPTTRTVDNFILQLRKKIEKDPAHPKHIITVHTQGYKFNS